MILEIAQKLRFNHDIKYIKISKSYPIHVIRQLATMIHPGINSIRKIMNTSRNSCSGLGVPELPHPCPW